MFDTICTLPLPSELFAQSIHPNFPLLAIGLATGHVQIHGLPPCTAPDGNPISESGRGTIDTVWRTRRHKGSCRSLSFSPDGSFLFSAGTDGLVKGASSATGQVVSKIAIPQNKCAISCLCIVVLALLYRHLLIYPYNLRCSTDPATVIHALNPASFLLATDSSALYTYDLRTNATFASARPQQTHHPHDDYISSISPLSPSDKSTSGFSKQWLSTGGTTIAVTDLRKGVLTQSEDLDEELLSSAVVGEKMAVGGERGVVRIWKQGEWDLEDKRAVVDRGESLDVICAVPEELGEMAAIGMGSGKIRLVDVRQRKALREMSHDEVEGVVGLGFDNDGRMISGGGLVVKVWQQSGLDDHDIDDEATEMLSGDGDVSEANDSDVVQDENSEEDAEGKGGKKRKKRKRNKGRAVVGPKNGITAFKGLD